MSTIRATAEMFITWSLVSHFMFKAIVSAKIVLAAIN